MVNKKLLIILGLIALVAILVALYFFGFIGGNKGVYLENPLKSTILVLCYKYGKFDKRKKVYKAIDKNGLVFESSEIYPDKITSWIENFLREKNKMEK